MGGLNSSEVLTDSGSQNLKISRDIINRKLEERYKKGEITEKTYKYINEQILYIEDDQKKHNDANILCLGVELTPEVIADIVIAYLTTDFEGGRHQRRVNKITDLEG